MPSRSPTRREPAASCRGSVSAEHIATVVIVAALIVAVLRAGVPQSVGDWGAYAACRLFSTQDCEQPGATTTLAGDEPSAASELPTPTGLTDEDLQPSSCLVLRESDQAGYQVKFGFVTFGEDYGFIRQEFSDGTVRLTVVDDVSFGAQASTGTKIIDIGRLGTDEVVGAKVDFGGGLSFGYGDTWVFDSVEQEEAMREQLDEYLMQRMQDRNAARDPGGGTGLFLYRWLFGGFAEPPKDPSVTFSRIGAEAALTGTAGLRSPLGNDAEGEMRYLDPQVGGRLELDASYDVLVEHDHDAGTRSYTYTLTGSATAGADVTVGRGGFTGSSTGAVTETYDADNQLVSLEFTTTREGGASGSLGVGNPIEGGSGPTARAGRTETTATVTTTALTIETDEQRQLAEAWLADNNQRFGVPFSLSMGHAVPDERVPGDAFQNLLYEQAEVTHTTYDDVTDVWRFGLEVNLGKQFGMSVHHVTGQRSVNDAGFLGAPAATGQRPWLQDTTCR